MIEYVPVILICNSLLSSMECKEGGRDTTIVMGEMQNTPMSCFQEGYTRSAKLAFAPQQGDHYYVKVKCVPRDMSHER
jgi:hypothetical protein